MATKSQGFSSRVADQEIVLGVSELVTICGERAEAAGWHNDFPKQEDFADTPGGRKAFDQAVASWDAIKLALMASESIEGFEEVRNGKPVTETYYPLHLPNSLVAEVGVERAEELMADQPRKPEGVPSELADIVIRAFDYAWFRDIDIMGAIFEKLEYNAKRGQRHGGKGF